MNKSKILITLVIFLITLVSVTPVSVTAQSTLQTEDVFWYGQENIVLDDPNLDSNTKYNIYSDDGDYFESQVKSNSSAEISIDTVNFDGDDLSLTGGDLSDPIEFRIVNQDLNVKLNESVVLNGENVVMTVNSDRSEFDVNVTSEQIDADDINSVINISTTRTDVKNDETLRINNLKNDENILVNSDKLPTGVIDFNFSVTDTSATDETSIRTSDNPRGIVRFEKGTYINTVGNKFQITFDLPSDVNEFDLGIKGNNYNHNVTIVDENKNNSASVYFDSLEAGNASKPITADEGTKIKNQEEDSLIITDLLPVGDYNLTVSVDGLETDTSNMEVQSVGSNEIKYRGISEDLLNIDKNDVINSSKTRNISRNDSVVFSVKVGGIQNILDNNSAEPDDLDYNTPFSNQHNMYLNITESGDDELYNLNNEDQLIIDERNATFYMIVDAEDLLSINDEDYDENLGDDDIDTLESFESKFILEKDSPLTDEKIVSESNYSINVTESTVIPEINTEYDNGYVIHNDTLNFTTSFVKSDTISFRFDTNESEYVKSADVTENQTLNISYNRNELSVGDEMNITVLDTNETYNYTIGETNIIDEIELPDDPKVGVESNIGVNIKDKYEDEDLDIDWEINGNSEDGEDFDYAFSESGEANIEVRIHNESKILFEVNNTTVNVDEGPYNPDLSISAREDVLFTGDESIFEPVNSYPGGGVSYEWEIDGDDVGDKKGLSYEFDHPGSKTITLRSELDGSVKRASKDINVYSSYGESERIYNYFS